MVHTFPLHTGTGTELWLPLCLPPILINDCVHPSLFMVSTNSKMWQGRSVSQVSFLLGQVRCGIAPQQPFSLRQGRAGIALNRHGSLEISIKYLFQRMGLSHSLYILGSSAWFSHSSPLLNHKLITNTITISTCLPTMLMWEPVYINKPQHRHPFPVVLVTSKLLNDPESPGHVH